LSFFRWGELILAQKLAPAEARTPACFKQEEDMALLDSALEEYIPVVLAFGRDIYGEFAGEDYAPPRDSVNGSHPAQVFWPFHKPEHKGYLD
jgi:hypothetical protein